MKLQNSFHCYNFSITLYITNGITQQITIAIELVEDIPTAVIQFHLKRMVETNSAEAPRLRFNPIASADPAGSISPSPISKKNPTSTNRNGK